MPRLLEALVLAAASLAAPALAQQDPQPRLPDAMPPCVDAGEDGAWEVDGATHRARFGRNGATLTVRENSALTLRLTDWGTAGHASTIAHRAAERTTEDLLEYHHQGITERYRLTADGFEQSFVIASRPDGAGDLVLGITATSDMLHAAARDADHQTIAFVDADGAPVILYGQAVAFGRGGPRVPIATRCDGAGRLELIVPAALLASATYPLVVDPLVGPQLQLGGWSSNDSNSDVDFDAQHQVFCVVWQRQLGANDVRIRAARVNRDGVVIGGATAVTGAGFFGTPTVTTVLVAGVVRFYLVWSSSTGLLGQYMDASTGAMLGSAQQLTTVPLGTRDRRPAVSAGNDRIVLAWDRTQSGVVEPQEILVRAMTLTTGTTVNLLPEHLVESTVFGYVRRPRMPRRLFLLGAPFARLCWEHFYITPAPGDTDLRTATFAAGTSLSYLQSPANLDGASAIGVDERNQDIGAIPGTLSPDYLIAWQENGDIKGQYYDLDGMVSGEFAIAAHPTLVESEPAVGAGSTEFSVGYLRADAGSPSITHTVRATRLLGGSTTVESDSLLFYTSGWTNAAPRASSVATIVGTDKSNAVLFTWTNVSTPGGAQDDIRAQLYEPVTVLATPYGVGCPGPNGISPSISQVERAMPGNQNHAIVLTDAPANSLTVLVISDILTTVPIPGAPGCELYAGLPMVLALPTVTSASGGAIANLPIPIGAVPGATLAFQWAVYTPGHNAFGWIVSNDLDLHWYQ